MKCPFCRAYRCVSVWSHQACKSNLHIPWQFRRWYLQFSFLPYAVLYCTSLLQHKPFMPVLLNQKDFILNFLSYRFSPYILFYYRKSFEEVKVRSCFSKMALGPFPPSSLHPSLNPWITVEHLSPCTSITLSFIPPSSLIHIITDPLCLTANNFNSSLKQESKKAFLHSVTDS